MADAQNETRKLIENLKQQRDELRLKVHLATADARDEWAKAEQQWEHLRAKMSQVGGALSDTTKDVWAAIKLVAEEIEHGYARIRKLF